MNWLGIKMSTLQVDWEKKVAKNYFKKIQEQNLLLDICMAISRQPQSGICNN